MGDVIFIALIFAGFAFCWLVVIGYERL